MNRAEFKICFDKICKYYSTNYAEDKDFIEIYFNEMKRVNFNIEYFLELVFNKCKFFPKVTELRDIRFKVEEEQKRDRQYNTEQKIECSICNGTGIVTVLEENRYEYITACTCANGDKWVWRSEKTGYYIPRYTEKVGEYKCVR